MSEQTVQSKNSSSLENAQATAEAWIKTEGGGAYWPPEMIGNKLAEELGEITEELLRFHDPKAYGDYSAKNLGLELGDAIFAVVCMANSHKIGLQGAFQTSPAGGSSKSLLELAALLTLEVGKVTKDVLRLHGPKKKDKFNPNDLETHLRGVASAIVSIASSQSIDLDQAWGETLEKYNIRDAGRWTK
jgi:NTP pyrophosphatase (non-canonical NTP hydrolase)